MPPATSRAACPAAAIRPPTTVTAAAIGSAEARYIRCSTHGSCTGTTLDVGASRSRKARIMKPATGRRVTFVADQTAAATARAAGASSQASRPKGSVRSTPPWSSERPQGRRSRERYQRITVGWLRAYRKDCQAVNPASGYRDRWTMTTAIAIGIVAKSTACQAPRRATTSRHDDATNARSARSTIGGTTTTHSLQPMPTAQVTVATATHGSGHGAAVARRNAASVASAENAASSSIRW